MKTPVPAPVAVTVVHDGPNLLWQCEACEKPGRSLDGLYVHQALFGHDDFVVVGGGSAKNLVAGFHRPNPKKP